MDRFIWNHNRREAARMLGAEGMSPKDVAQELGVSTKLIGIWRQHPAFDALVVEMQKEAAAVVLNKGIANKIKRIEAQVGRWERLQQVIDERAEDPNIQQEPGGKTGLMVRTVKMSGPYIVEEYAVDTGLLKEMREIEKLVGQEVGDTDSRNVMDIRAIIINLAQQEGLSPEETDQAMHDAMRMLGPGHPQS